MTTTISVHQPEIKVQTCGGSIWMHVPISEDDTAYLAVFVSAEQASEIGYQLTSAAEKAQRIAAINAEAVA